MSNTNQQHDQKPKRLRVRARALLEESNNESTNIRSTDPCTSSVDGDVAGRYEVDYTNFLLSLHHTSRPIRRSLPAIHSLLAHKPQHRPRPGHSKRQRMGMGMGNINTNTNTNTNMNMTKQEIKEEADYNKEKQRIYRTGKGMPLLQQCFAKLPNHAGNDIDKQSNQISEKNEAGSGPASGLIKKREREGEGDKREHDQDHIYGKEGERKNSTITCPLDQPSTILTAGHHKRFRELMAYFAPHSTGTLDPNNLSYIDRQSRKKEFATLVQLFQEERRLYYDALRTFWERKENIERFGLGFKLDPKGVAGQVVGVKQRYIDACKDKWTGSGGSGNDSMIKYGACIQTVNLNRSNQTPRRHEYNAGAGAGNHDNNHKQAMTIETFAPEVLHRRCIIAGARKRTRTHTHVGIAANENIPTVPMDQIHTLLNARTKLKVPTTLVRGVGDRDLSSPRSSPSKEEGGSLFLKDDAMARKLALENHADVVVTDAVLETLMKKHPSPGGGNVYGTSPSDANTSAAPATAMDQWTLPVSCQKIKLLSSESEERAGAGVNRAKERDVVFVEDPLPSPSLSRECLAFGFTEALYGTLANHSTLSKNQADIDTKNPNIITSKNNEESGYPHSREYVYTLLKVPKHGCGPSHTFRILVRSVNYLHSDCSSESILNGEREPEPIHIESRIEYFHDQNRGMDIVPVKERAHWFVLKLLQPNIRILSCRIEPVMGRIVEVGEKTIADAITVEEEAVVGEERGMKSLYVFGSMAGSGFGSGSGIDCSSEGKLHPDGETLAQQPLRVETLMDSMIDILFAATKLERNYQRRSIMCFPGRLARHGFEAASSSASSTSILPSSHYPAMNYSWNVASIHREEKRESACNSDETICATVDVLKEMEDANQVYLTPDYRLWSWSTNDRLPYTFPLGSENVDF